MKIGCYAEEFTQYGTTIWETASGVKLEITSVFDNEEDAKQYCERTGGNIVSKELVEYVRSGVVNTLPRKEKL